MDKPKVKKPFLSFSMGGRGKMYLLLLILFIFVIICIAYGGNEFKKSFDPKYDPDISL